MIKKNAKKKTSVVARSVPYDDLLIKALKDHKLAIAYLNNALEATKNGDPDGLSLLLIALRNVIQAHGGMAKMAKKTGLGRESLYKTLSEKGNPEFRTIATLSSALGLELKFT